MGALQASPPACTSRVHVTAPSSLRKRTSAVRSPLRRKWSITLVYRAPMAMHSRRRCANRRRISVRNSPLAMSPASRRIQTVPVLRSCIRSEAITGASRSFWPWGPLRAKSVSTVNSNMPVEESPIAPLVMASSSPARTSLWSEAVSPQLRSRCSSPASHAR